MILSFFYIPLSGPGVCLKKKKIIIIIIIFLTPGTTFPGVLEIGYVNPRNG